MSRCFNVLVVTFILILLSNLIVGHIGMYYAFAWKHNKERSLRVGVNLWLFICGVLVYIQIVSWSITDLL